MLRCLCIWVPWCSGWLHSGGRNGSERLFPLKCSNTSLLFIGEWNTISTESRRWGGPPMILLTLLIAVLLFLVLGLFRTHSTANKLAGLSWEELIAKLEPVETEAITTVAVEYLNPGKSQAWLGPDEMWNMIGRADGLARMRANADVLIAIAAHAQRWNPAEGVIVAEQMRQDGLALRR